VISTQIARASAALLVVSALPLLFAPDAILPHLIPTFPASGIWLGQLLAAALLGLAALNWLSQSALLGGIYSRPVVLANAAFYFISTMVLLKVVMRDAPAALWIAFVVMAVFACTYGLLLFRGPLESDFKTQQRSD
jgi:hypothetical protein